MGYEILGGDVLNVPEKHIVQWVKESFEIELAIRKILSMQGVSRW
jgi:hypothetical protein